MLLVNDIACFLETFAPARLAESWDNVGLLAGDRNRPVSKVMTCLTITPSSAQEAIDAGAELIVTHHPLPFRPLKRLSTDTPEGKLLCDLLAARIAIYSPHTAFDSAAAGINQQLAEGIGLADIRPLVCQPDGQLGAGRFGRPAAGLTIGQVAERLKRFLSVGQLQAVGQAGQTVRAIAVACGSAGEFLEPARQAGCQLLVTGEVRFHTCLEAEAAGVGLLLAGHFASERFAVVALAEVLAAAFQSIEVWSSRQERDPLGWM
jgi:dinuclear metal center YbgI/SA1388 family protein